MESGDTWCVAFPATPMAARTVRGWVRGHLAHLGVDTGDAVTIASELFAASLDGEVVVMTVSTVGPRVRLSASLPPGIPPCLRPQWRVIQGLAHECGHDATSAWALIHL